MDTNYGDTYTSQDRISWFYKNKLRKATNLIQRIVLIGLVIVGLFYTDKWLNTMTDNYINNQVQQQLSK